MIQDQIHNVIWYMYFIIPELRIPPKTYWLYRNIMQISWVDAMYLNEIAISRKVIGKTTIDHLILTTILIWHNADLNGSIRNLDPHVYDKLWPPHWPCLIFYADLALLYLNITLHVTFNLTASHLHLPNLVPTNPGLCQTSHSYPLQSLNPLPQPPRPICPVDPWLETSQDPVSV